MYCFLDSAHSVDIGEFAPAYSQNRIRHYNCICSIIRAIGTRCFLETRAIHAAKSLQGDAVSPFPLLAAAYTRATGDSCWFVMLLSHIPHHTAHTASNLCDTMGDNNIAQNAESHLPQVVSPAPCGDRRSLTIAQGATLPHAVQCTGPRRAN